MLIAKDKIAHIAIGLATIVWLWLENYVQAHAGHEYAVALATTSVGIAIEAYQRVRKEGEPSVLDFVATAAPGWVYALVMLQLR